MDPTFSLASVLPTTNAAAAAAWAWVAETLAVSDRADTSLLHGIFSSVPSLLGESSRAARERIALKYLEEWLDSRWPGPPLPCGDAGEIDPEGSAEDVLLRLLDKAATSDVLPEKGTELFKRELRQFVLKKRSSLPKCSIDKLLDKNRGCIQADSTKEKSGFSRAEVVDHNGFQYHSNRNSDNQNIENGEKRMSSFTDDRLCKLKKISSDQSYDANKGILQEFPSGSGQRSPQQNDDATQLRKQLPAVSRNNNWQENMQEDLRGYGQQPSQQIHEQNDENLESTKHVSSVVAVENGCNISKDNSGRGQLNASKGDDAHRDTNITCDEAILQGPCGSGRKSHLQKDQHSSKELQSSKEIIAGDTYKQISRVGASGSWKQLSNVADDPMAANQQKKMLGERNLNPNVPVVEDMEGDTIGNGLCFKCDKGGLLLNCSSGNCSVAVHESCMGSSITFDQKGCFICPVCSYTRAAVSYSRAKKRYFQAKKAFESFVGKDSERQSQEELSPTEILRKKG